MKHLLLKPYLKYLLLILSFSNVYGQEVEYTTDTTSYDSGVTKVKKNTFVSGVGGESHVCFYNSEGVLIRRYTTNIGLIDGLYEEYYAGSEKKEFSYYNRGSKIGYSVGFHSNGQIKFKGWYLDVNRFPDLKYTYTILKYEDPFGDSVMVEAVDINSIKVDEWNYWNDTGDLVKTELWENGILVKQEEFVVPVEIDK